MRISAPFPARLNVFRLSVALIAATCLVALPARAQTFRVSSNPALAELKLAHLNRFFRSLTVAYNESEEWWEPELSIDWRWDDRLKPVLGLRTEGAC
ncbi:unnamed protein product, partial [Closterium sp. Naga37s-1]